MSNVYARNRKPSVYKKFLSIRLIDKELFSMYESKKEKYFPKYHKKVFFEIHSTNLKLIKYGSTVYNERCRSANSLTSIDRCIRLLNLIITGTEENIQLLTNHMMELNLQEKDVTKSKQKIANRFIRVIESYLIYEESMKTYYKTLKKKRKNIMNKTLQ